MRGAIPAQHAGTNLVGVQEPHRAFRAVRCITPCCGLFVDNCIYIALGRHIAVCECKRHMQKLACFSYYEQTALRAPRRKHSRTAHMQLKSSSEILRCKITSEQRNACAHAYHSRRSGGVISREATAQTQLPFRSRRSGGVIWFREGSRKEGDRIVALFKLEWELGLSSGFTENYSSRSP